MSKYEIDDSVKRTVKGRHKYNGLPKDEYWRICHEYQAQFYRDFDPKDLRPGVNIPVQKGHRTPEYYEERGIELNYEKYEGIDDDEIVEYKHGTKGIILLTAKEARKKGRERACKVAYQNEIGHSKVKKILGASVGHRLLCDMPLARRIARVEGIHHEKVSKHLMVRIERRYKKMAKKNKNLPTEASSPVVNKIFADGGKALDSSIEIRTHGMQHQGKCLAYPTTDDLQMQCNMFLAYCQEVEKVPTTIGLRQWLGLTSSQYNKYLAMGNAHSEVLEFMDDFFHGYTLEKAMEGNVPHLLYVYLSKNWWGMTDKVEQVVTTTQTGLDTSDKSAVMASISDLAVIDVEFDEDDDWSDLD